MSANVSKVKGKYAYKISWHFSDPVTVKNFNIYRSESADKGYVLFGTAAQMDSTLVDSVINFDKSYYYFVKAISRSGKRYKESNAMFALSYFPKKLSVPTLILAEGVPGGVKLIVDKIDPKAEGIRVFRNDGMTLELSAVSGLIKKSDRESINFVRPGRSAPTPANIVLNLGMMNTSRKATMRIAATLTMMGYVIAPEILRASL